MKFVRLPVLIFSLVLPLSASDGYEQQLASTLSNHILVLRNFYTDAPLKFDSDGKLTSNANPGFGPTDGRVFVHQVQLTPNKLILIGTRPLYIFNRTKVIWEVRDTGRSVSIDILLPPENQPILRFRASSTQYS